MTLIAILCFVTALGVTWCFPDPFSHQTSVLLYSDTCPDCQKLGNAVGTLDSPVKVDREVNVHNQKEKERFFNDVNLTKEQRSKLQTPSVLVLEKGHGRRWDVDKIITLETSEP